MIKVISNSDSLSTWYLDPGIPFGDGTQETPYYWDAVCDEDRTGISGTVSSSSHQYYKILLKSGITYTFRYNKDGSWDGDMRISFYDSDGTAVKDSWDSDPIEQFDYTPTKDGLCTLRIQPYSSYSGSFKYLVTPAPEQFIGNPGWKKKEGLAQGDGWNKKTGKVFEYRTLEKANIKYNDYINGLLYWDSNAASTISSFDDAVNKFQTGANGPIFTTKFNLVDGEGTLISGYTDYFIVKMKGYIKIENPGTYKFFTNQDDQVAMKVHDKTGYYSGASSSFGERISIDLEKGYYDFEFYFAEGSGNQYYNIKWQPPGATTYEDIPYGIFCCKTQDVPSEYFTISSPQYLTSNTSDPNWEISASGEKYGDTQAWCAFAPGNSWRGVGGTWGSGGLPSWIQWRNLNNKVLIKRYKIQGCANYGSITAWTLEGSNDGNNWTIIDTQNIGSFPSGSEFKEFDCSTNNTSYYYHRLNITASEDSDCPVGQIITYSK